jgi:hypothetical protein
MVLLSTRVICFCDAARRTVYPLSIWMQPINAGESHEAMEFAHL